MKPVIGRRLAIRIQKFLRRLFGIQRFVFWVRAVRESARRYFRENLGAPFVIGFQVLLLVTAGLLVMGNSVLANDVAVYAYYLLVVGVVLQLISFLKYGRPEQ